MRSTVGTPEQLRALAEDDGLPLTCKARADRVQVCTAVWDVGNVDDGLPHTDAFLEMSVHCLVNAVSRRSTHELIPSVPRLSLARCCELDLRILGGGEF